jgi:hypothetical protein
MMDMRRIASIVLLVSASASCGTAQAPAVERATDERPSGTITGHVRLAGPAVENATPGMRADPMCVKAAAGRTFLQDAVVAGTDGSLANVLVQLRETFQPSMLRPAGDNRSACLCLQPSRRRPPTRSTLLVINSDPGLTTSAVNQQAAIGSTWASQCRAWNTFEMSDEGILRLKCDVHLWMVAYVGIVKHPYFAVTGGTGTFEIRNVPAGSHSVQAWHERYGRLTSIARLEPGGTTNVEFAYSGTEKTPEDWPSTLR